MNGLITLIKKILFIDNLKILKNQIINYFK